MQQVMPWLWMRQWLRGGTICHLFSIPLLSLVRKVINLMIACVLVSFIKGSLSRTCHRYLMQCSFIFLNCMLSSKEGRGSLFLGPAPPQPFKILYKSSRLKRLHSFPPFTPNIKLSKIQFIFHKGWCENYRPHPQACYKALFRGFATVFHSKTSLFLFIANWTQLFENELNLTVCHCLLKRKWLVHVKILCQSTLLFSFSFLLSFSLFSFSLFFFLFFPFFLWILPKRF